MIRSLRGALGWGSLLGLGVWACTSASAADGEVRSNAPQRTLAASAKSTPPSVPADAPGEAIGSSALEHRLDKLEKGLQGSPL